MKTVRLDVPSHAEVYRLEEPDGFLALHRTRLGPAFGGIRAQRYPDSDSALADCLRLSEAMSLKCAVNGIPGGGGKAVLRLESLHDRAAAFTALGDFVESLGGRFVTGTDVGVSGADIDVLRGRTSHVSCQELSEQAAAGVLHALEAALEVVRGAPLVRGLTIAVQGLGAVGLKLALKLSERGATVKAADPDPSRVELARAARLQIVDPSRILETPADLLSPCALGGAITAGLVPALNTSIVCGAANNQLHDDSVATTLHEAGVTYVPDFLANSGATIWGAWSYLSGPGDYSERVRAVRDTVVSLLTDARASGRPPLSLALAAASARLGAA